MLLQENMVVADRYRLVRMIGRGGMGSVWQAQHMGLDSPCAIKFIEGELANVAEAHARFEREAKAAASLRSPHVVQIFDHGVWQGMPYIAMELLDGEDLGKRLARAGGRLAPSEVNNIVQEVCRALSKAHAAGVVHRDLKPDNIFLVNDDDGRKITKILDFGVAKSAAQGIDGSNTKTGAMLGTPYYMSPEQAQGIKSVDARSDLWSLAVIVFQCITGRLPFESEALGDLLVKIIVNPIPRPSAYDPNVPPGFDGWWAKAAERNPDHRFPTAKAFAESLQIALGQSAATDATDRARLQKVSGGTAVIGQGPPNAPTPVGLQAGPIAGMNTPQPGHQSAAHYPHMMTPGGVRHDSGPLGAHAAQAGFNTGNPIAATFSGVDQPVVVPKKGPPVAAIAAICGGFLLIGVVAGGIALVSGSKKPTAAGTADPTASGSVATATVPAPHATEGPVAKNGASGAAPTMTATTEPTPPTPSAPASGATAAAAGGGAKTATPPSGGSVAAKPTAATTGGSTPTAATKPTSTTVPTTKPTTKPKPTDLGF